MAGSFARSVAGAAGAVWQAILFGSRPAFVIDLNEGKASLRSGKAPVKFLQSCEEIATSASLATGKIRGVPEKRGIVLVFSRDIPEMTHQQFRNAWHPER